MNRTRRKAVRNLMEQVESLKAAFEEILGEEEKNLENIVENFRHSNRREQSEEACFQLDWAISKLEDAIIHSEEAIKQAKRKA